MIADDIANNPQNPHPGKVFNRPGGPDVYAGVPIDYSGKDVTAANFLHVLTGNTEALKGVGSGKVRQPQVRRAWRCWRTGSIFANERRWCRRRLRQFM